MPPDAVFFGGFGDVVQMQAYFGAFAGQGPTDASLDAAFMRIETLVWSYEPFPHEERIYTEVAKQHAAGHAPLHAEAGGLLQDAHRAAGVLTGSAFPRFYARFGWDDARTAAFHALVFGRLALTGLLPAITACCAVSRDTEVGLALPEVPLIGHPDARRAFQRLMDLAMDAVTTEAFQDPDTAWLALARQYTRFLCYTQHEENFQDAMQGRLDGVERRLRSLEDRDGRETFGGSF